MHVCMYASHPQTPLTRNWFCFEEKKRQKKEGRRRSWVRNLMPIHFVRFLIFFLFLPCQLVQLPKSKYIFVGLR